MCDLIGEGALDRLTRLVITNAVFFKGEWEAPFKLEANYKLPDTLRALGMTRAFIDPASPNGAQFDKMTDSQNPQERLFIAAVLHKTFVDVSEVGTEAVAATAIVLRPVSGYTSDEPPKTRPFVPVFKADKPFLFLIRDRETGSILFMGRYGAICGGG